MSEQIRDQDGRLLNSQSSGEQGEDSTHEFHVFYGDANGDRQVTPDELLPLFENYNRADAAGEILTVYDLDRDGDIDILDWVMVFPNVENRLEDANINYRAPPGTWIGGYGENANDWDHPLNWSLGGVPDVDASVVIPKESIQVPIVPSEITINELSIESGGTLSVFSGIVVSDDVRVNGSLILDQGTLTVGNTLQVREDGTLLGNGTINGFLVNQGRIQFDDVSGVLTVKGDFQQTETGSLLIGVTPGEEGLAHNSVNVSGQADLDGELILY
ncbi:MAG TPA: hypothetical protein EYQ50_04050 [Verrucomicrobiales bacterium]|nr:hypothetical protein [Verrucomicrobiales bacterium]HIL68224.1 hypothetical protein [Verrucomicrobiota bacterium]